MERRANCSSRSSALLRRHCAKSSALTGRTISMRRGGSCSATSKVSLQRNELTGTSRSSLILAIKSAGGADARVVKDCRDPRCVQSTPTAKNSEGANDVRDREILYDKA